MLKIFSARNPIGWFIYFILIFLCVFTLFAAVSCTITQSYKICFMVDGNTYNTAIPVANKAIEIPRHPKKEGYIFSGWYMDNDQWDIPFIANESLELSSDLFVYARWTPDGNNPDIKPTESEFFTFFLLEDNTYSIRKANNATLPSDIYLPKVYNNKPVTRIDNGDDSNDGAFSSTDIKSVFIPDNYISIGSYAFSGCSKLITVSFGHNSNLLSIDNNAFASCNSMINITIPESVLSIGDQSFTSCGLSDFIIPASVISIGESAFGYCQYLSDITIPESVMSIGGFAFSYTAIERNTPNGGVVYAGNWAVAYKRDYNIDKPSVTLNAGTKGIADSTFYNSQIIAITIPTGVKSIGSKAFYGCSLREITIPESVINIGISAFSGNGIKSVTFKGNSQLKSIGGLAFYANVSLMDFAIPESVISIGDWAFRNTGIWNNTPNAEVVYVDNWAVGYKEYPSSIIEVSFLPGTKGISSGAFCNCLSLKNVIIPSSVKVIGENAFTNNNIESFTVDSDNPNYRSIDGILYDKALTRLIQCPGDKIGAVVIPSSVRNIDDAAFFRCLELTEVTLPSNLTSISYQTFYECSSLTKITIPSSVRSIGDYAFYDCKKLNNVTFEENSKLKSIGENAFSLCNTLTEITIPEGVINIGNYTFSWELISVYLTSKTPPYLGFSAFEPHASDFKIYVPADLLNTYQTAEDWYEYKEYITALP